MQPSELHTLTVVDDVDALGPQRVHGEGQPLLGGGGGVLRLRLGRRLEGVDQELVVGHRVGRLRALGSLIQFGPDALEPRLADAYLARREQGADVDVGLHKLDAEHRSALTVLDGQAIELGIERQQVDADAVDRYPRLELLRQQTDGLGEHLLLQPVGIEQGKATGQQGDQRYCEHDGGDGGPFEESFHRFFLNDIQRAGHRATSGRRDDASRQGQWSFGQPCRAFWTVRYTRQTVRG